MSITVKNKKVRQRNKTKAIVDPNVGSYDKDPFFVKKANTAKALLKETGLPKK